MIRKSFILFVCLAVAFVNLFAQTDIDEFRKKLEKIQKNVDSLYPKKIDKFIRYKSLTTLFIGVNKTVLHNDPQRGFGISLYFPVGLFFSNYTNYNDPIPATYYAKEYVENLGKELNIQGIPFTPASLNQSQSNYKTYNFGVYLSAFRPVYFMAGLSLINGQVWNIYSGDYAGYLANSGTPGNYAMDYYKVKSANFIVGIAIVYPFLQVEAGYNKLFNSYFVNVGINAPIFNVGIFKSKSTHKK